MIALDACITGYDPTSVELIPEESSERLFADAVPLAGFESEIGQQSENAIHRFRGLYHAAERLLDVGGPLRCR